VPIRSPAPTPKNAQTKNESDRTDAAARLRRKAARSFLLLLGHGVAEQVPTRSSTWSFCRTLTVPGGMFDTSDLRRSTISFFGTVTASPDGGRRTSTRSSSRSIRPVSGAVPQVRLVPAPQVGRQQAPLVAVDLREVAEVVPLRD